MTEQTIRRTKHLSDRAVQGALLLRVLGHWGIFLVAAGGLLLFFELASLNLQGSPSQAVDHLLRRHAPTLLALVVLAPYFIRDLCKLSNRFAGPMVRLRNAMRSLKEGETVHPIRFRDDDFWQELADDFNVIIARLQAAESSVKKMESTAVDEEIESPRDVPQEAVALTS